MRHSTLFLFILLLNVWTCSYGQNNPFSVGFKTGINLSDAMEKTSYTVGDKSSKLGYQIGIITEYDVGSSVYLGSGLSLSNKGTTHKGRIMSIGGIADWKKTTNQIYLHLPLTMGYKISLSDIVKVRFNAGLYFAYGIGGKEVTETIFTPAGARDNETIKNPTFGNTHDGYSYFPFNFDRKDYGATFGTGVQYKKIFVSADYEIGLLNLYKPYNTDNPLPASYKNRNLALTIGYMLK